LVRAVVVTELGQQGDAVQIGVVLVMVVVGVVHVLVVVVVQ
jgi:hypothetical protein